VCNGFYRREIITNNDVFFDESVRVNEDGLFNFRLISKCDKICVIDDYVYIYRQWKSSEKNKLLSKDDRFDACEEALKHYIENLEADFELQLQCRKISVLFWNAIRIRESKCNWKQAKEFLQGILSAEDLTTSFEALNYSEMNIYKKVLCESLKHRRLFLFYILIKYLTPILQSVIKR
jgi:quinol monooxygenase YgiN